MNPKPFKPAIGLSNPHLQTVLSGAGRKLFSSKPVKEFLGSAQQHTLEIDNVHLCFELNIQPNRPLVVLIPGWLGSSQSTYVISCAHALWKAGYSVARITLRDHGSTAHLNQSLFHSAIIDEVIELVDILAEDHGELGVGLAGFSLGGNFALRLAKARPKLEVLAVCPAIQPADTMYRIDRSAIYQGYFVRKWRNLWRQKQQAFPQHYDFSEAMKLTTVSAITDYFVARYLPFPSTHAYFSAYDLSGDSLQGVDAHILAAKDDPIIPPQQYQGLPSTITVDLTQHGGHSAFLKNWWLESWLDDYIVSHFQPLLSEIPAPSATVQ